MRMPALVVLIIGIITCRGLGRQAVVIDRDPQETALVVTGIK
jgi:hypothetical protein